MSLLNTKTGFTTPWHCSVALMADGEWVSAPMGDFKEDDNLEVIYEDGRPSYFKQNKHVLENRMEDKISATNLQTSNTFEDRSTRFIADNNTALEKCQQQPSVVVSILAI